MLGHSIRGSYSPGLRICSPYQLRGSSSPAMGQQQPRGSSSWTPTSPPSPRQLSIHLPHRFPRFGRFLKGIPCHMGHMSNCIFIHLSTGSRGCVLCSSAHSCPLHSHCKTHHVHADKDNSVRHIPGQQEALSQTDHVKQAIPASLAGFLQLDTGIHPDNVSL